MYINGVIFHYSVTRRPFGGSLQRSVHLSSGVQLRLLVQQRRNLKETRSKTALRVQPENLGRRTRRGRGRGRRRSQVNRELRLWELCCSHARGNTTPPSIQVHVGVSYSALSQMTAVNYSFVTQISITLHGAHKTCLFHNLLWLI